MDPKGQFPFRSVWKKEKTNFKRKFKGFKKRKEKL